MSFYKLTDNYFYASRIDSGSYIHTAQSPVTSSVYFRFKPTGSLPMRLFETTSDIYFGIDSTGSLYFNSGSELSVIPNAQIQTRLTEGFYSLLIKTDTDSLNTYDVLLGYQTLQDTNIRSIKIKSGSITTPALYSEINLGKGFSGYIQDYRIYNEVINTDVFTFYCENPFSYFGNTVYSYWDTLVYRLPLGIDKKKYNHNTQTIVSSSHPNVTYLLSDSYASGVAANFSDNTSYVGFYEAQFSKQPIIGSYIESTDKVVITNNYVTGSLEKDYNNRTIFSVPGDSHIGLYFNLNKAVNNDIINSLGAINMGDYIGGWDATPTEEYQQLESVKETYLRNYIRPNNVKAQLRQVKYFNNSLFTHTEQFIPARSSLLKGVLIDNHYLKRNCVKYVAQTLNSNKLDYSGSLSSSLYSNVNGANFSHYIDSQYSVFPYGGTLSDIIVDNGATSGSMMPVVTASKVSEYFQKNVSILGTWYYAEVSDFLDLGTQNRLYNGCKITSTGIGQPSLDTPNQEPAVEVYLSDGTSLFTIEGGVAIN